MFCVLVLILRTSAYRLHEAAISFGGGLCRPAGTENKPSALSLVRQWRVGTPARERAVLRTSVKETTACLTAKNK